METTTFILKAKQIHGDKYDYSKSVYKNALTKLCVICPKHGDFYIRPNSHISGKQGCRKCGIQRRHQNNSKSISDFIVGCKKIHGNLYDYSKVVYKNNHTNVEIVCPTHSSFWQKPNAHLSGQGCPPCRRNHHKCIEEYMSLTKICDVCHIEKPITEYYIDGRYYRGKCKSCEKLIKCEYRKVPLNRERYKKYIKKYKADRRKTDPIYRLRVDFPTIIRRAMTKKYYNDSVWNYLPYTPIELKEHLEKQFDGKMTWENCGTYWHIDHIIPQAMFHYDSETHPDFQKCWALTNLRPLNAHLNMRKSSIYNGKRITNKYLLS